MFISQDSDVKETLILTATKCENGFYLDIFSIMLWNSWVSDIVQIFLIILM